MNIRLNIFRVPVIIFLVLFINISFYPGGAIADNCQGGADCLKCTELTHRHFPGTVAGMQDSDCRAAGQDSKCGFEARQIPDEFQGIVSSDRSYYQVHTGIFVAASDEYSQTRLPDGFVPQFLLYDSDVTSSIYLLNQALLC